METHAVRDLFSPDPYAQLVAEVRDFAIFLLDTAGCVASWNVGARLLFGYEEAEILGQPGHILFAPEDRAAGVPESEMSRAASEGRAEDVRPHRRKDGSRFWANIVTTAMRGEDGSLRGFAKIARDDTARQQAEDALRESEQNLRFTIESSPQVPWTADAQGLIESFSERWLQLTGLPREAALGEGWASMQHPDDVAKMVAAWNHAVQSGESYDIEHRIRIADGSYRWLRSRATPRRDEAGRIVRWYGTTEEIHASKVAEEERERLIGSLEFERARLAHIFARVPAFVALLRGPEHVFELTNPAYQQIIGHRDALGKPFRQALPELEGQGFFELLDQVLATGTPFEGRGLRVMLQREPGAPPQEVWVDFLYEPLLGVDGRPEGIFIHGLDITEQVRAREAAEFERARLAEVFDRSPAFVAILRGPELIYEMFNPAYQQLAGHRDFIGRGIREALPEVEGQGFFEMLDQVFASGTPYQEHETRVLLQREPGGPLEERFVDVLFQALFEADGRASGVFVHGVDITEQVHARQQVEFERARLADIFAHSPASVAIVRGSEHRFELVNPAFLQTVGPRDLLGLPARQAMPELEGQGFFELLDDVLATGQPFVSHEVRVLLECEPGQPPQEQFMDVLYQPLLEADGSISGIFSHNIDITEQVRARKEAEDANRIKDEFLATLSHELRTPLSAILGWARLLRSGAIDDETTAMALATIERNAQAQARLIEDILDVSRVITGKLRLDVQPVDLASIIEDAVNTVLPAAQAKGVRLQRVLDSGASMVSGDPARLQQIVWNLLANAMKFTPREGRVQVRLERINSHVEIVVADSGLGIAPDVLPHIFERFRQADSSSTRSHGGLGLGLAIVRHLVELHGGSVEVESAGLGTGATFTVKLPLVAVRTAEASGPERVHPTASQGSPFESTPLLSGLHVLIVDDEGDTRILLRAVLEGCGARVTSTGSVPEAMQALREERPDVLVSDLGMPGEDGYSLIKQVRALPPEEGGATPAAALTAYARAEDRTRVLRSGFQLHVPKPVEPVELVTVVANLAGRVGE